MTSPILTSPALTSFQIERFRAFARGAARTAAETGQLPPELQGASIDDIEAEFDAWFEANKGTLAASTVDVAFLMIDRGLGRYIDPRIEQFQLAAMTDDQLVDYQETRAGDLHLRLEQNAAARAALLTAMETSLRIFIGIGLQAALML